MSKKQRRRDARFRVFSPDLGKGIEESAPNKEQAVAMADQLAEQNPGTTVGVWNPRNEHIYQVSLDGGKWTVYVNPEDASPEELAGQEHLMMVNVHQPRSQAMTYASAKVPRIIVKGAVYKQAQLQELLQQYESASGQIIKILTNAHQAALGKDFGKANSTLKKLEGVMDDKALGELMELNDTMAGVAGLEGGN